VRDTGADLGVVVAFGQLLPPELLEVLPLGFVNLHFSRLPRWRGAAPVERAILAGDTETGVDVMRVEAGLDTGPVFASRVVPIGPGEAAGELHERLVAVGTELLVETVPRIASIEPRPQSGEATYAEKLSVDEFRLDPHRPAAELDRIVRAGNPRPGAWAEVGGRRVKVWRAHVEGDHLELDEVQPEGKARMDAAAWRAGLRAAPPVFGR
jgi:methionyl-tRNA formyltransferase